MRRPGFPVVWLALIASLSAVASEARAADLDFGSHWHDGRAELNGYQLTVTRYGEPRKGQAVMVYVTEPFSETRHVKLEDPSRNPDDAVEVLKLNLVRDFQTGIYDYNTMVSLFVRSSDFSPVKTTFTSAEWCGHVYDEMVFGPDRIGHRYSSYFEDESSSGSIELEPGGVLEDNLLVLLRGLRGAYLAPGQKRTVPFLPSAFHNRLTHRPAGWTRAEIQRLASPQTVEVPAGSFTTDVYVVDVAGGRQGRIHLDRRYPHRVVRWTWRSGRSARSGGDGDEEGALTGTARLPYWKLHDNGQESYLRQLGLAPLGGMLPK